MVVSLHNLHRLLLVIPKIFLYCLLDRGAGQREVGCYFYSVTSSLIFTVLIFPETR